jgi:hypothetical protein
MTPFTDTWRQLNIFIDVLFPTVNSWLLTVALLWCWRLTRPALCWICAGVDRYGATDIKGKHVGSFGRSDTLNQCTTQSFNQFANWNNYWNDNNKNSHNCTICRLANYFSCTNCLLHSTKCRPDSADNSRYWWATYLRLCALLPISGRIWKFAIL